MSTQRTRLLVGLAALSALALTLSSGSQASAGDRKAVAHTTGGKRVATSLPAPTPKLFDYHHHAGEPTLGITRSGAVVVTAGAGCVTSCAGSTHTLETVTPGGRAVFITRDKGKTFQDVSPGKAGVSPNVTSQDPYLLVDHSAESDRTFDVDLNLACNMLSYSDDEGASWISNPLSCGEPVNDHQTVFTGKAIKSPHPLYPSLVYYCFNKLAYTDCTKSIDGGLTFRTSSSTVRRPATRNRISRSWIGR